MLLMLAACTSSSEPEQSSPMPTNVFTGAADEVKLMTLDPGHFHAALVQKNTYPSVDSVVYVYAPEGEDLQQHLNRIEQYNTRDDSPTNWKEKVSVGPDFFAQDDRGATRQRVGAIG